MYAKVHIGLPNMDTVYASGVELGWNPGLDPITMKNTGWWQVL